MKLTLENIRVDDHKIIDQSGRIRGIIIYEYIRGSHLYGTNIDTSDEDRGGIFIMPDSSLIGLGTDYQSEIKDASGDTCIWEINRFMQLALSSNPTVLEALFVPDDKVIYEHPAVKELRSHRDEFVTKKCFAPFGGYAVSQIKKAQGQNKKIHWEMENMTRKSPLDFCYTFYGQGSQNICDWLSERGLEQRNCGLVSVPNMPDMYGVYYDWGQHIRLNDITKNYFSDIFNIDNDPFVSYCYDDLLGKMMDIENALQSPDQRRWAMELLYDEIKEPKGGYCGIISQNNDSNEVRFTSVSKNDIPICFMSYNANAYATHCRRYKEYEDWRKHRNKARYESNMEGEKSGNPDMMYDSKNMCHCFRLMTMAKEVAEGKGIRLDRTDIDRDFLLDVRNRRFGYSELNEKMLALKEEMDKAIKSSTIREEICSDDVNELLMKLSNQFKW